jgi:hypothetical protein
LSTREIRLCVDSYKRYQREQEAKKNTKKRKKKNDPTPRTKSVKVSIDESNSAEKKISTRIKLSTKRKRSDETSKAEEGEGKASTISQKRKSLPRSDALNTSDLVLLPQPDNDSGTGKASSISQKRKSPPHNPEGRNTIDLTLSPDNDSGAGKASCIPQKRRSQRSRKGGDTIGLTLSPNNASPKVQKMKPAKSSMSSFETIRQQVLAKRLERKNASRKSSAPTMEGGDNIQRQSFRKRKAKRIYSPSSNYTVALTTSTGGTSNDEGEINSEPMYHIDLTIGRKKKSTNIDNIIVDTPSPGTDTSKKSASKEKEDSKLSAPKKKLAMSESSYSSENSEKQQKIRASAPGGSTSLGTTLTVTTPIGKSEKTVSKEKVDSKLSTPEKKSNISQSSSSPIAIISKKFSQFWDKAESTISAAVGFTGKNAFGIRAQKKRSFSSSKVSNDASTSHQNAHSSSAKHQDSSTMEMTKVSKGEFLSEGQVEICNENMTADAAPPSVHQESVAPSIPAKVKASATTENVPGARPEPSTPLTVQTNQKGTPSIDQHTESDEINKLETSEIESEAISENDFIRRSNRNRSAVASGEESQFGEVGFQYSKYFPGHGVYRGMVIEIVPGEYIIDNVPTIIRSSDIFPIH